MKSIDYSSLYGDDEFDDQLDKNFYSASISPRDYMSSESPAVSIPRNASLEEFNTDDYSDSDYEGKLEIEQEEDDADVEGDGEGDGEVEEGGNNLDSGDEEGIFVCEDIKATGNGHINEMDRKEISANGEWNEATGGVNIRQGAHDIKGSKSDNSVNGDQKAKSKDADTSSSMGSHAEHSSEGIEGLQEEPYSDGERREGPPPPIGGLQEGTKQCTEYQSLECEAHWYCGTNVRDEIPPENGQQSEGGKVEETRSDAHQAEQTTREGSDENKEGMRLPIAGPTSLKGLSGLRSLDELNVQISMCGSLLLKTTQNDQVIESGPKFCYSDAIMILGRTKYFRQTYGIIRGIFTQA